MSFVRRFSADDGTLVQEDGIFNVPTLVSAVTSIDAQIAALAPVLNGPTMRTASALEPESAPWARWSRIQWFRLCFRVAMLNNAGHGDRYAAEHSDRQRAGPRREPPAHRLRQRLPGRLRRLRRTSVPDHCAVRADMACGSLHIDPRGRRLSSHPGPPSATRRRKDPSAAAHEIVESRASPAITTTG